MKFALHHFPLQSGFTYIGALVLVAIMGIMAAATAELWHTERKREREAELLFVGNQYRQAIGRYYDQGAGRVRAFPMRLEDLLQDPRTPGTRRYLRKLYPDPITDSMEWGLVKGPTGEILGVFSLSEEAPLKKSNFSRNDARLEDKQKYSEWMFVYTPGRSAPAVNDVQPIKPKPGGPRVPPRPAMAENRELTW
jgi:type II secretory pathway pseudopilin PulG